MINVNYARDLTEEQILQLCSEASVVTLGYAREFIELHNNLEDARATVNGMAHRLIEQGFLPETFVVDGVAKVWYMNGVLWLYKEVCNGNLHGIQKEYLHTGRLSQQCEYVHGVLVKEFEVFC